MSLHFAAECFTKLWLNTIQNYKEFISSESAETMTYFAIIVIPYQYYLDSQTDKLHVHDIRKSAQVKAVTPNR